MHNFSHFTKQCLSMLELFWVVSILEFLWYIIKKQLHGFCGASEQAYAGVVLCLRSVDNNHNPHIVLVMTKTKVAPVKSLTICTILRSSVTCRCTAARPKNQNLGQIPMKQLKPGLAFNRVGTDYTGHRSRLYKPCVYWMKELPNIL